MRITSKYDSTCRACGHAIRVGDKIDWEPGGNGARHVECPTTPSSQVGVRWRKHGQRASSVGASFSSVSTAGRGLPDGP